MRRSRVMWISVVGLLVIALADLAHPRISRTGIPTPYRSTVANHVAGCQGGFCVGNREPGGV